MKKWLSPLLSALVIALTALFLIIPLMAQQRETQKQTDLEQNGKSVFLYADFSPYGEIYQDYTVLSAPIASSTEHFRAAENCYPQNGSGSYDGTTSGLSYEFKLKTVPDTMYATYPLIQLYTELEEPYTLSIDLAELLDPSQEALDPDAVPSDEQWFVISGVSFSGATEDAVQVNFTFNLNPDWEYAPKNIILSYRGEELGGLNSLVYDSDSTPRTAETWFYIPRTDSEEKSGEATLIVREAARTVEATDAVYSSANTEFVMLRSEEVEARNSGK